MTLFCISFKRLSCPLVNKDMGIEDSPIPKTDGSLSQRTIAEISGVLSNKGNTIRGNDNALSVVHQWG